jgi:hypothetical protein
MVVYLPFLVWFVLLVGCLVDVDRTPDGSAHHLSTGSWFLVVLLVPILGSLAWLAAGRPRPAHATPALAGGSAPAAESLASTPGDSSVLEDDSLRALLARIDREFDEAVRRACRTGRGRKGSGTDPER